MNIREYEKQALVLLLNESNSFKEFLFKIGYSSSGKAYSYVKKYLDDIGVDYTNLTNVRWSSKIKSIEEVFVSGKSFCNKNLKQKILKHNLIPYRCNGIDELGCGNTGSWNGKPLNLHLDHINGDNNDNRIENLRFLCPNCHSQTETYSGKNKKK